MSDVKPSILITGANGFVGTRLCHQFLKEGFAVIAGVRTTSDLTSLESLNVRYRYGDVTQPDTLPDMVRDVDYIIHNAGITKAKNKQTFFDINESGTASLFKAIAQYNASVKKVIYISSLAAAGPSKEGVPLIEDCAPHPITTYGRSKLAGEQVALAFSSRIPVVSIRPPGIYGPGDKEIFGFFEAVHKGIRPLFGDLNRRLNIVHVDDLTHGVFLAVTKDTQSGAIYFIAEKESYSMAQLVSLLQEACGRKGLPLRLPAPLFRAVAAISELAFKAVRATPMLTRGKAAELLEWWEVSTEKARRELGFESRIPFAQGARETYDWYLRMEWLK